jgi:branched-chain amino acid transport system permease protein
MFTMDLSFIILTMVVLGGTGSITGSAIAAAVLFYLPEALRDIKPVTGASLAAAVIGVVVSVVLVKRLADHYHGPKLNKSGFMVASCVLGIVVWLVIAMALGKVPSLVAVTYEGSKLRMVIFAATLIILMLIRPQGVFAHHEFSWSWIGKLFGKRSPETAVSS